MLRALKKWKKILGAHKECKEISALLGGHQPFGA